MATITLDYNMRSIQATKALEYILSLGCFKPKENALTNLNGSKADLEFEQLFGAWESDKSAEKEVAELREARHFRNKK
ncbi:MAG: hypothetical protein LBR18_06600 [Tannerella sp.]|jgi:hypothetical protein|nr:hypothetical protein [Tannerella sp.]